MEMGKNTVTIEYEAGKIKNFEKRILSAGYCAAFLPASFVCAGAVEKMTCDCSGYKPLASCYPNNGRRALAVLEKCALALLLCREHLIDPRKMRLSGETVFLRADGEEVKLIYVPRSRCDTPVDADSTRCENSSSNSQCLVGGAINWVWLALAGHILERVEDDEARRYIKAAVDYAEGGGSLYDVINHIGELKQEIHVCGWNVEER